MDKATLSVSLARPILPTKAYQLTQPICLGPIPANTLGDPVVVGWGKTDPDQLSLSTNGVYSNDQLKLKVSLHYY